jgi:intraflagellar transport protein 74
LTIRADGLAEELRELQGQLGDYNTLVDKLHTDTDLEQVEKEYKALQAKNLKNSKLVDEIFLEKKQKEATLKELEKQIVAEQQKAELLIQQLVFSVKKLNFNRSHRVKSNLPF